MSFVYHLCTSKGPFIFHFRKTKSNVLLPGEITELLRVTGFPDGTEVVIPCEGDNSLMEETGWARIFLVVLPFCPFAQALFLFSEASLALWMENSLSP